jgi:hypothetical protein
MHNEALLCQKKVFGLTTLKSCPKERDTIPEEILVVPECQEVSKKDAAV